MADKKKQAARELTDEELDAAIAQLKLDGLFDKSKDAVSTPRQTKNVKFFDKRRAFMQEMLEAEFSYKRMVATLRKLDPVLFAKLSLTSVRSWVIAQDDLKAIVDAQVSAGKRVGPRRGSKLVQKPIEIAGVVSDPVTHRDAITEDAALLTQELVAPPAVLSDADAPVSSVGGGGSIASGASDEMRIDGLRVMPIPGSDDAVIELGSARDEEPRFVDILLPSDNHFRALCVPGLPDVVMAMQDVPSAQPGRPNMIFRGEYIFRDVAREFSKEEHGRHLGFKDWFPHDGLLDRSIGYWLANFLHGTDAEKAAAKADAITQAYADAFDARRSEAAKNWEHWGPFISRSKSS